MFDATHVAIIGGGIMGAATAYYLAQSGVESVLLERSTLADGTSGSGGGSIGLQEKSPGLTLQMGLRSAALYAQLEDELDYDVGYRACGGMVPIETEAEYLRVKDHLYPLIQQGLPISFWDGGTARELEPHLSKNVHAVSYCPLEAQVDPIRVTLAYAGAARRLGARIITHCKVLGIYTTQQRGFRVSTSLGEINADFVVNAAGVWATSIAQMVGIDIPVIPRKGHIVILEPQGRLIRTVMHGVKYFGIRFESTASENPDPWGVAFALEQRGPYVRVGSSREFAGFDRTVSTRINKAILREASRYVPLLARLGVAGSVGCLRPYTPDHKPIIGKTNELPNFVFATGHEGEGISMAPMTGKLVAQLITDGHTELPIDELSPSRLRDTKAEPVMPIQRL